MSDPENEDIDIEELFEILSNNTRRKILQLLATEALYPFQISKILDISPRIVGKYIAELEDMGIIKTIEKKSDKGPTRRYAQLNKSFSIMIDISPNNFNWKVVPISTTNQSLRKSLSANIRLEEESFAKIKEIKTHIQKKLKKLQEIDKERQQLIMDINIDFRQFNNFIEKAIKSYTDRVYVRTLFKEMINNKQNWISLSHLSNTLREWRGEVKERLFNIANETGLIKYREENGEIWFSI